MKLQENEEQIGQYQTWLTSEKGATQVLRQTGHDQNWKILTDIPYADILARFTFSSAIPLQPASRESETLVRKAQKDWGGVDVIYLLVKDFYSKKGYSMAPVPVWMLQDGITDGLIRQRYYDEIFHNNGRFAPNWNVAYIARTGHTPGSGPITG